MLVLYETPLGFCLFKVTDAGKIDSPDLWKEFESPERANSLLKLRALHRFTSTASAVEDITALQEGKISKSLKKFLTAEVVEKGKGKETLAVVDSKLGNAISKKLGIKVVADSTSLDLYRGIRTQIAALLDGLDPQDLATMSLGLSHSLSRFKVKFSPDKVDTMVVQAIALLDDLDKEINIYAMRVKEWYGWHFPEMSKILVDSVAYAKVVRLMGFRTNAATTSLASILPEDLEATIKAAAEISMGTEISDQDIAHIHQLCDQVISISAYRTQLSEYLRNRMTAIAPNLTALVGELVGARLISHAGSLLHLAKHPASTVQILGAEKALFRALKTKHDTPKYGLIYHASLVGQAPPKLKGKMARMVATKTALSVRVDALADADDKSEGDAARIGLEARVKLESRLRALEMQDDVSGARRYGEAGGPSARKTQKVELHGDAARTYNASADVVPGQEDLVPAQRDPLEAAVRAVLDVKDEKKRAKEEKRKKKAEKNGVANGDESAMEVDEEKKEKKEKKKRRESEVVAADIRALDSDAAGGREETEEERAARKRAKKEKKAAKAALKDSSPETSPEKKSKKRRASEVDGDADGEKKKKKKKSSD
ncbi:Nop-domain-containing protein [Exidia glandulosa HHB12029]|uniref:Nucleolar protein 58 n=1 Tax=Exidia glandulosa HHB12029 TaxID=1314781 RepID=A0A165R2P9_EXIGL|nr:Nop-domain-containing protein [Exidia glandulosa HHB12029]